MASETLKILHVGCGGMSRAWLNAVKTMDDAEIVGLVDLHKQTAWQRAEEFGLNDKGTRISDNLDEALEQLKPDVVFDCTFPAAHAEITTKSLRAGAHVLGEKPLADTPDHARQSLTAAKETGKLYAVIQNRRYQDSIRSLRKFLQSGEIGQIHTVNCDFYIGAHFGGFRDVMEHVLLLDMAIHTFDQARFLSGSNPETVFCHEFNPQGSWYEHGASAMAIFEMTGGLIYNYRGSWCAEGLNTSWESEWRIIGTKGSCTWDGAETIRAEVIEETGDFKSKMRPVDVAIEPFPGKNDGHAGLIREFLDAVKGGSQPETICTDNIHSLNMVFGAVESALTGKRIDVAHPVIVSA